MMNTQKFLCNMLSQLVLATGDVVAKIHCTILECL
jgi:hypothetical protein